MHAQLTSQLFPSHPTPSHPLTQPPSLSLSLPLSPSLSLSLSICSVPLVIQPGSVTVCMVQCMVQYACWRLPSSLISLCAVCRLVWRAGVTAPATATTPRLCPTALQYARAGKTSTIAAPSWHLVARRGAAQRGAVRGTRYAVRGASCQRHHGTRCPRHHLTTMAPSSPRGRSRWMS